MDRYHCNIGGTPASPNSSGSFGTGIDLIEVYTVAELLTAVGTPDVIAVALDAAPPGQLSEAVAAAGSLSHPGLRPLWRRKRNTRGKTDEVFDGYGVLTGTDIVRLADGELLTA